MKKILVVIGSALSMSISHWGLVHIYTRVCQPIGIWGLAYSTITLDSTVCKTIWSVADTLKTNYNSLLGGVITWNFFKT